MRWCVAVACCVLAPVAACQLVAGLEPPREIAPVVDSGGDAPDGGQEPGFLCRRRFPAPPDRDGLDGRPGDDGYVMAIRGFIIGRDDAGVLPGVDMDCADTNCAASSPPSSCTSRGGGVDTCDEPGGVDNQVARALLQSNLVFQSGEPIGGPQIADGTYGELIWVFNYTGLADDSTVAVYLLPSPFMILNPGPFCTSPRVASIPARYGVTPNWDGCDEWAIDPRFTRATAPAAALRGYVRDSVLYVPPAGSSDARMSLRLGMSLATLQTPGVIAPLERLRDDGTPAGRDEVAQMLRVRRGTAFGRATVPAILDFLSRYRLSPSTACLPLAAFQFIQGRACGSEDLPASGDEVGRPCGSVSLGVRFDAEPAVRGPSADAGTPDERCVRGLSTAELDDGGFLSCEAGGR